MTGPEGGFGATTARRGTAPRVGGPRSAAALYRLFAARQGGRCNEALRLLEFERCFDAFTYATLQRLPLRQGWNVLELGAGHGSVALWLVEAVGEGGTVTATDVIPLDHLRHNEKDNLHILHHDIACDPLPEATFDCVHARAVLHLLPNQAAVLAKLRASLRPDGYLVIEEVDLQRAIQGGGSSLSKVLSALDRHATTVDVGSSNSVRLAGALIDAGLMDVEVAITEFSFGSNPATSRLWQLTLQATAEFLISSGCLEAEVTAALAELADPALRAPAPSLITVIGRAP
jgi:SAM-dependent methyltransferase